MGSWHPTVGSCLFVMSCEKSTVQGAAVLMDLGVRYLTGVHRHLAGEGGGWRGCSGGLRSKDRRRWWLRLLTLTLAYGFKGYGVLKLSSNAMEGGTSRGDTWRHLSMGDPRVELC